MIIKNYEICQSCVPVKSRWWLEGLNAIELNFLEIKFLYRLKNSKFLNEFENSSGIFIPLFVFCVYSVNRCIFIFQNKPEIAQTMRKTVDARIFTLECFEFSGTHFFCFAHFHRTSKCSKCLLSDYRNFQFYLIIEVLLQISVPTHDKHIFLRPKKVCLFWEMCLFLENVLILGSGGFLNVFPKKRTKNYQKTPNSVLHYKFIQR